jgi:CBS domain-containing protein
MVMLSEFLSFRVIDDNGESANLIDLVISQLDKDYPLVTHLVYRQNRRSQRVVPWDTVKGIDWANHEIKLNDYGQAQDMDTLGQVVQLQRDVLDALILDLQNRRATLANDLWLEEDAGQLRLSAADTSARAILRRLTRGRYQGINRRILYDWKYVEFLRGDPQAVQAGEGYHRRIIHLPPGEIAHLTAAVPYLHAAELLQLLPEQLAADTLEVMSPEGQLQVFEELEGKFALLVLQHMAPDLAADIIGRLDIKAAQHYLNRLPKKSGERIVDLLKYPEHTVGGIMTNDVVTVSPKLKAGEARSALRERLKEPDFVYFLYVVDDQAPHKLRGVVSLRYFLMAEDDQTIEEIMNPYLITLAPFESSQEAAYRLLNSQLAALPVVGAKGQLLGTVTIDAAVSQVAPRSWRAQAPKVFS